MPRLENPAASLGIRFQDVIDILGGLLKERNWKDFDPSSVKLFYSPHYIFNYDALVEQEVRGQVISKGFSGKMAINAANAKLEPIITQIMDNKPIEFSKEIDEDVDYKYEIEDVFISEEELKETCAIKIASRFNIAKDNVATSAFRLVYWPVWVLYVRIAGGGTHKLIIDGVSGYPMNIEEVPEREKGWIEVSADTFNKLKSPSGWASLGKTAAKVTAGGIKGAVKGGEEERESGSTLHWLLYTKSGRYTILLILFLIGLLYFLYS